MEADAVFLGRHFPIVHGCERLHPRFRRPLGAGDEGKNARGDTIFVSLNIEHHLQRFFEFFLLKGNGWYLLNLNRKFWASYVHKFS
jgi:hypothetical protein